MSRIGKMPVAIPKGVQVAIQGNTVKVNGPRGELSRTFSPTMQIEMKDGQVVVQRPSDERAVRALHGTTRALIRNMVAGVSEGFSKVLQIEGVGYRAEMKGKQLVMALGYSHPVEVDPPPGIAFAVDDKTKTITISGIDKELVGQVASDVRKWRPPEPYKGKGLRYLGEHVRRKAGKAGKVG
ncbi:MAG TPA: 50S ribosomal protein L6 [Anaerolineales bacterium]|nr:50S ribosomal protein L6 [Anaerolineales bacterium]